MDDKQIARLRETLENKKSELNERITGIKKDLSSGLDRDSEEQATQLENHEVLDALANEATRELALINQALTRMDEGEYGICSSCGKKIDERRLEAKPHALRCISCASAGEAIGPT
jgi:RNA polymerase-binding protein DksA